MKSPELKAVVDRNKLKRTVGCNEKYLSMYPFIYFQKCYGCAPSMIAAHNVDELALKDLNIFFFMDIDVQPLFMGSGFYGRPVLLELQQGIWLYLMITSADENHIYVFFEPEKKDAAEKFLADLPRKEIKKQARIGYIVHTSSSFNIQTAELQSQPLDLDFYNEGFENVDAQVKDWLKDWKRRGLTILHGSPGTGKTSYLRHLASESGGLIYIPPSLSSEIGQPSFLGFLAAHPHQVFLLEDAENVIVSTGPERTCALQNILNATDGLLGDIIKAKFILTFNTNIHKIDSALLRPGRAAVIHEFTKLTPDKTSRLLEKLGKNHVEGSLSLAEVFNAGVAGAETLNHEKPAIGFSR